MHVRWRGLELPARVLVDEKSKTRTFSRFIVEPFERGFGTTVGNSLRRILLSSVEGAAVTCIKIDGVEHEFSTIPGVLEDVTDIILNVKGLVIGMEGFGASAPYSDLATHFGFTASSVAARTKAHV